MNGDITLVALCHCQRAFKVISPFIIFAVFDGLFRRYKLLHFNDLHRPLTLFSAHGIFEDEYLKYRASNGQSYYTTVIIGNHV